MLTKLKIRVRVSNQVLDQVDEQVYAKVDEQIECQIWDQTAIQVWAPVLTLAYGSLRQESS